LDLLVYKFQIFLIVWSRIAAMFFLAPVLSSSDLPVRFRVLLAFAITIVIFPWVSKLGIKIPQSMLMYVTIVLNEVLIGMIIGFFLTLIFASFRLGTQFFATQIGLGMSQVFDPITQTQTPLLGYLFYSVVILVFISIGGFHMVIRAVVDSYQIVPFLDIIAHGEFLMKEVIRYFSFMFMVALKLAFPVIASSLVLMICIGLIGKAAPQTNIMIMGLPIQLGVGLILILSLLPFMIDIFSSIFSNAVNEVMILLAKVKRV